MRQTVHAIFRVLIPRVAKGDAGAMISFIDMLGLADENIAVSALNALQQRVINEAFQDFSAALQAPDSRRPPSMVSLAIAGAFETRMIALLEQESAIDREDGQTSISPALRTALDRYARTSMEMRRSISQNKPLRTAVNHLTAFTYRIVSWGHSFAGNARVRARHWLAKIRNLLG